MTKSKKKPAYVHPHKQPRKQQIKRERGFWLTFMLAVVFIRNIASAIAIWGIRQSQDETTTPLLISLLVVLSLADVVSAVAMWYWKKWGFYLFLVSSAASGAASMLMTGYPFIILAAILPPVILGYIMRLQNKWEMFE